MLLNGNWIRYILFSAAISLIVGLILALWYFFYRRLQKEFQQLSFAKMTADDQYIQLSSYHELLQEKLKQQTTDLNRVIGKLNQTKEEFDNFVSNTPYHVGAPVQELMDLCNIALTDVTDDLAIGYLRKLNITLDRMNSILSRLMTVNRINSHVVLSSKVNLNEIIDEIFTYERKKGLPRRFRLITNASLDVDYSIISDATLVRIILANLIENAIQFYNSSDRLDPFVVVRLMEQEGFMKIYIEDNGVGIKHSKGNNVFQMFMRSDRSVVGGIGLYLAKIATEKIRGHINLAHSDPDGSSFEIILPSDINKVLSLWR
jgi:signal transduction histidine kinase